MAVTISDLPPSPGLTGPEVFAIDQGVATLRVTASQIVAFLSGNIPAINLATDVNGVLPVANGGATGYNAKVYGAVGDGAARPLSTVFTTLSAAQAVYPSAASLTEELDYNAIR